MRNNEYLTNDNYAYFPELDIDEFDSGISILIRHDYFSSDNEHGQQLLKTLLMQYIASKKRITNLFIVDTGVLLLNTEHVCNNIFNSLISHSEEIYVCRDSIDFYNVSFTDSSNNTLVDSSVFFNILSNQKNIIVI